MVMPISSILMTTDAIMWHWYELSRRTSWTPSGGRFTMRYAPSTSSTQTSMQCSSIHTESWHALMDIGLSIGNSRIVIHQLGLPLKIIIGVRKSLAAVMARATLTLFVWLDVLWTWMVFIPLFSRVLDEWYKKFRVVWSMLKVHHMLQCGPMDGPPQEMPWPCCPPRWVSIWPCLSHGDRYSHASALSKRWPSAWQLMTYG
jgi:hypothetical protein